MVKERGAYMKLFNKNEEKIDENNSSPLYFEKIKKINEILDGDYPITQRGVGGSQARWSKQITS